MTEAILLAISLALAGVTYHFAFPPGRARIRLALIDWLSRLASTFSSPGRTRIRLELVGWLSRLTSTFYALLAISLVLALVVWQEGSAAASLSRHIAPFPAVKDVAWVPPFPGAKARSWVLTTVLSARSVVQFYRDARHRRGWEIEEAGTNVLILRKDDLCLHITANPDAGPKHGATILYTLRQDCR